MQGKGGMKRMLDGRGIPWLSRMLFFAQGRKDGWVDEWSLSCFLNIDAFSHLRWFIGSLACEITPYSSSLIFISRLLHYMNFILTSALHVLE